MLVNGFLFLLLKLLWALWDFDRDGEVLSNEEGGSDSGNVSQSVRPPKLRHCRSAASDGLWRTNAEGLIEDGALGTDRQREQAGGSRVTAWWDGRRDTCRLSSKPFLLYCRLSICRLTFTYLKLTFYWRLACDAKWRCIVDSSALLQHPGLNS